MARNQNRNPRFKRVVWRCDKSVCLKYNTRKIPYSLIINDDKCDHCGLFIHEPLTKQVSPSARTEEN